MHSQKATVATAGARRPACASHPQLYFSERPEELEQARGLCRTCALRHACLDGALRRGEPWGVWGGELVLHGAVIAGKRPRGRPRKDRAAA
jgi:WhiB family transcriptional regulator, redox-sensing transcriptional regulator